MLSINLDYLINDGISTSLESKEASLISIYPNPTSNFLIVDLEKLIVSEEALLQVSDITGRTVHEVSVTQQTENILDISSLKPGLYNLLVIDINEVISNQQFIKE